jgi:hypothetical protein
MTTCRSSPNLSHNFVSGPSEPGIAIARTTNRLLVPIAHTRGELPEISGQSPIAKKIIAKVMPNALF